MGSRARNLVWPLILLLHKLTFIHCVLYGKFLIINLWNLLSDVVDSDPANDELYTRMMEQKMKRQENKKGKGNQNNVCCVAGMKNNHFEFNFLTHCSSLFIIPQEYLLSLIEVRVMVVAVTAGRLQ